MPLPGSVWRRRWPRLAGRVRSSGSGLPRLAHRLGQPPVDDQGLAVLADDDVARLDVAVQDAAAVGVVDGVADVEEPPQQLAQLQASDAPSPGLRPPSPRGRVG